MHAHHAKVRGHGLGEEGRWRPAGGGASQAPPTHIVHFRPWSRKRLRRGCRWHEGVAAHKGAGVAAVLEAALASAPHEVIEGAPLTAWVPAVTVLTTKATVAVGPQVKVIVIAVAGAVRIVLGQARPGIIGLERLEAEGAAKKAQPITTLSGHLNASCKADFPIFRTAKPHHHASLLNAQKINRPKSLSNTVEKGHEALATGMGRVC